MFKDNKNLKQAAEEVLRNYLLRCFSKASKEYPEVAKMEPEAGVEKLLQLRRENKIKIELKTLNSLVKCSIQNVN